VYNKTVLLNNGTDRHAQLHTCHILDGSVMKVTECRNLWKDPRVDPWRQSMHSYSLWLTTPKKHWEPIAHRPTQRSQLRMSGNTAGRLEDIDRH